MRRKAPQAPPEPPQPRPASLHLQPYPEAPSAVLTRPYDPSVTDIVYPGLTVTIATRDIDVFLQADEALRRRWLSERRKAIEAVKRS